MSALQTNGFNCGIHALLQCKSILIGDSKMHDISSKQQMQDTSEYRLNIMSLTSTLYDTYNEETYENHKDHLFMNTDHNYTSGTLFKWQHIYNLFNNGDLK
jgi:hypothetical protein